MDAIQLSHLKHIQEAYLTNRLVLFVGAGVSANSGVPNWNQLTKALRDELPPSVHAGQDDLKVAQLYKVARGPKEYLEKVKETLKHNQVLPNAIHRAILDLNPVHIITTNYDDLIEQEIDSTQEQYSVISKDSDLPKKNYSSTLVKMHGDFENGNIVLCEEEYYNYSKNFPLIRAFVQSVFANKLVLFIGFSFADLNLKMILNEITRILGKDMQRAYLLSLEKPERIIEQYFLDKYINIVHLSEDDYSEIRLFQNNTGYSGDNRVSELNDLGRKLYDYLWAIKSFDVEKKSDIIPYIYNQIKPYFDQIRVLGSGIKYFIKPLHKNMYWSEGSHGVQTFTKIFDNLAEELKDQKNRFSLFHKLGVTACRELLKFAFYNSLYSIDNLIIIDKNTYKHITPYLSDESYEMIGRFDFKCLQQRIDALKHRPIKGNIGDLELGYIYYQLEKYIEAYKAFAKLLPIAWKRGKYALYFLCLYNIYSLRYAIKHQGEWNNIPEAKAPFLWLDGMNLGERLSRLGLKMEIRHFFEDLLANRFLIDNLVEAEKRKENLHSQRESSRRGGSSINSDLSALLGIHSRTEMFYNENYLVKSPFETYTAIGRNTVIGILNSHTIIDLRQDEELSFIWGRNTKLERLDANIIRILLTSVGFDELKKIFKQYGITSITIDDEGEKYLCQSILNLSDGIYQSFLCNSVRNYILNLLFIISKLKIEALNTTLLYATIQKLFSDVWCQHSIESFLNELIQNNPPSTSDALSLLKTILLSKCRKGQYTMVVYSLSAIIGKGKKYLSPFNSYVNTTTPIDIIANLTNAIAPDEKDQFYKFSLPILAAEPLCYVAFVSKNKLVPNVDLEQFTLLFDKELSSDPFEINRAKLSFYLSKWRNNNNCHQWWSIIDSLAKKHAVLRFVMDPENFDMPETVNPEWLKVFDKNRVSELVKNPIYARILIKQVAEEKKYMPDVVENLLSVFYDCEDTTTTQTNETENS